MGGPLCSSPLLPSTPALVSEGRRRSSGPAPHHNRCRAQLLWLGVGRAVDRTYRVHAHFIAMVQFNLCWSQSLLPPWRTLTGRPCPPRTGAHILTLLWSVWVSYIGVQEIDVQNESRWRSQNDCWARAERTVRPDFTVCKHEGKIHAGVSIHS